jgi:YtkA-like
MKRFISITLTLAAAAAIAGCMSAPSELDLSLTRATADSKFVVTLQPPATPAAINQLHTWQVRLATPAGAPIAHARIKVDGGMPQHGHGLPTRPQVTQEPSDGTYLIEGMKFSMTGWWEIKLAIESPEGSDKVTFNTVVSERGAGR